MLLELRVQNRLISRSRAELRCGVKASLEKTARGGALDITALQTDRGALGEECRKAIR